MRIAEYLNMPEAPVSTCMDEFEVLASEEGGEIYDFDGDTGAGLLFDDMQHVVFRSLQEKDSITLMLSVIVGKAFRVGCMYGRRVVAPEDRD